MSEGTQGLSEQERAELERLRAEKAERERAERDRAERAELERLRAERERAEYDARVAEVRERNRRAMEPDEDLKMPLGQKLVLLVLAIIVAVFVMSFVGGGLISG